MAGDIAAFEAAVGDMCESSDLPSGSIGNNRCRCCTAGRANVQVWQLSIKQPGDFRANAVRVPQQRKTMNGLDAGKLGGQRIVVRLPIHFTAALHFLR